MKQLLFLIVGAMLLLSACGTSKQRVVVKEKSLPSWYLKPPLSNERELYGVGEGKDKQEALSNALASLLATLSVSISSSYSAKSIVREGAVNTHNSTYINEIKSEVKKIRISNYEVIDSAQLGFKKYALLIKVDRKKFFLSLKKELQQKFEAIDSQERSVKQQNVLAQLKFYNEAIAGFADLQNRLLVMSVLNEAFNAKPYLQKFAILKSKRERLLQKITFWIQSDYKALVSPIAQGLSTKEIRLKKVESSAHFTIVINSNIEKATAYGFYIARAQIEIKTKDNRGNVLAVNTLNITGQSSQGFSIAKQDIAKKLNQLVKREGIAKILNLDI